MTDSDSRSLTAGSVATLVFLCVCFLTQAFGSPPLDYPAVLGAVFTGFVRPAIGSGWWIVGLIWLIGGGVIVIPLIYSRFAYRRLPGPTFVRGILLAGFFWVISIALAWPSIGAYLPTARYTAPILFILTSIAAHIVYGLVLGGLAGPLDDKLPARQADRQEGAMASELHDGNERAA